MGEQITKEVLEVLIGGEFLEEWNTNNSCANSHRMHIQKETE